MATFTCYLPDDLLARLDEHVGKPPLGTRSGIMREALEQLLESQPTTVKDVFNEAIKPGLKVSKEVAETPWIKEEMKGSRADAFRRATQR